VPLLCASIELGKWERMHAGVWHDVKIRAQYKSVLKGAVWRSFLHEGSDKCGYHSSGFFILLKKKSRSGGICL
jgi:hypothetical protein